MLPDKYVDEVKRHRRHRYTFKHIVISLILLGSMYLLGPLVHELSHIAWLKIQNCHYTTNIGFNLLIGLNGSIQPLCYLEKSSAILFYSLGYISTILAGMSLILAGDIGEKLDIYLMASGIGMLLSALLTINIKGDLSSLLSVLNIGDMNFMAISLFVTLGLLGTSIKAVEILIESLERKE